MSDGRGPARAADDVAGGVDLRLSLASRISPMTYSRAPAVGIAVGDARDAALGIGAEPRQLREVAVEARAVDARRRAAGARRWRLTIHRGPAPTRRRRRGERQSRDDSLNRWTIVRRRGAERHPVEKCPLVGGEATYALLLRLRDDTVHLLDVHRMQAVAGDRFPARDLLTVAGEPEPALPEGRRLQLPLVCAAGRPEVDPSEIQKGAEIAAEVSEVGDAAAGRSEPGP